MKIQTLLEKVMSTKLLHIYISKRSKWPSQPFYWWCWVFFIKCYNFGWCLPFVIAFMLSRNWKIVSECTTFHLMSVILMYLSCCHCIALVCDIKKILYEVYALPYQRFSLFHMIAGYRQILSFPICYGLSLFDSFGDESPKITGEFWSKTRLSLLKNQILWQWCV